MGASTVFRFSVFKGVHRLFKYSVVEAEELCSSPASMMKGFPFTISCQLPCSFFTSLEGTSVFVDVYIGGRAFIIEVPIIKIRHTNNFFIVVFYLKVTGIE